MISNWMKNKEKIYQQASDKLTQNLLKSRPSPKYIPLFNALYKIYRAVRNKGHVIDINWLWSKAQRLYSEITGNPDATVRLHVVVSFMKKFKIRMRRKQRSKKKSKATLEPGLQKWHATTREKLIRVNKEGEYDDKWGRFPPSMRYNVDQTPLPFVINRDRTYHNFEEGESQRHDKVWISQPGSGLDKRQCTLQVCLRASGKQPKLGIIFRGKGKGISADEKLAWNGCLFSAKCMGRCYHISAVGRENSKSNCKG